MSCQLRSEAYHILRGYNAVCWVLQCNPTYDLSIISHNHNHNHIPAINLFTTKSNEVKCAYVPHKISNTRSPNLKSLSNNPLMLYIYIFCHSFDWCDAPIVYSIYIIWIFDQQISIMLICKKINNKCLYSGRGDSPYMQMENWKQGKRQVWSWICVCVVDCFVVMINAHMWVGGYLVLCLSGNLTIQLYILINFIHIYISKFEKIHIFIYIYLSWQKFLPFQQNMI